MVSVRKRKNLTKSLNGQTPRKRENMTAKELEQMFQDKTLVKGRYYTIVYARTENGYTKTTKTKVRFVNYYNIATIKAMGKTPTTQPSANTQVIIPHILTYNTNTKNYLVHCYKTPNGKAKTTYQDQNGNTITQQEYEMVNPPKKTYPNNSPVFQIKLHEIVSIG